MGQFVSSLVQEVSVALQPREKQLTDQVCSAQWVTVSSGWEVPWWGVQGKGSQQRQAFLRQHVPNLHVSELTLL